MKEDLLNKNYEILEHYGIEEQIIIWIEEMSELTKELCKWQRKKYLTSEHLKAMKFEVTDVQVSLDQIKKAINYALEEQEENYEFKVDRQLERMKEEK